MFLLFKRKKYKEASFHLLIDRVASKLNASLHVFAAYLQYKTNRFTNRQKQVVVAIFLFSSGYLSVSIAMSGIVKTRPFSIPVIAPINIKHIGTTDESAKLRVMITSNDYKKIMSYKTYLDSLNNIVYGKHALHNILLRRKGLLDTLTFLETIFNKQQQEMLWKRKHNY